MDIKSIHLKKGNGEAWAGHGRLRLSPDLVFKEDRSEVEGNFGAAEPTGSE